MCLFFFFQLQENESPNFQSICLKCVHMFIMFHMPMDMLYIPTNERIQCRKSGAVLYSNPSVLDKLHCTQLWLAVIASMI